MRVCGFWKTDCATHQKRAYLQDFDRDVHLILCYFLRIEVLGQVIVDVKYMRPINHI